VGIEHKVVVSLPETDTSNGMDFSYDPPDVLCSGCGFQPNVMDAEGGRIVICGQNFGSQPPTVSEPEISVRIDDVPCDQLTWARDSFTCGNMPYLRCETPALVVGQKNITISVGGQESSWLASSAVFATRCKYQSYGRIGEMCLQCDDKDVFGSVDAAHCEDQWNGLWGDEPVSNPGWWEIALVEEEERVKCHEERLNRDECPFFLPCEPKSSCL